MALSIGYRGWESREAFEEARERFAAWLQANADRYEAFGPLRMMGWNSPMVPASRRYYEIQQPVRERKSDPDIDPGRPIEMAMRPQ